VHHIITVQARLSSTHRYYLKGLFTFAICSPLSHKEMYGLLREDTKVPLGNTPHILLLFCVVNQQQVMTVQLIRFISRAKKKPNADMNQLLCKQLPHCRQLVADGYSKLCQHGETRHARRQLYGDFTKAKKVWRAQYRKKFPFLQINCISRGRKAGERPLGKKTQTPT